jgi:hypothetical protein
MNEPLRVAYVADLNPYARTLIRLNALREEGCQVWEITSVARGDDALGYRQPFLWERVLLKLGFHLDFIGAGRRLLALAQAQPLDVIWIDKGLTISRAVLARAKAIAGAKAVAFAEDDMALAHNQSRRWLGALKAYDLVVTTKTKNIEGRELEALGAKAVLYTPQTYDPAKHYPTPMTEAERKAWASEVAFVGTFEKERAKSLLALAEAGFEVRVWGSEWAGKMSHSNLRVEGRAVVNTHEKLDYSKALTGAKISLGFLRKLNRDQHTSRSLEIPACGSLLLAERTPTHQALFAEGVEADFFENDAEMISKVGYYLNNEAKRLEVAAAGRARCVKDHAPLGQIRAILRRLGEL